MGSPVLIVSVDEAGNITLEEQTWAYALWRDDGFTWEEYIYCKIHLGMELTYKLGGWPEMTTPFILDILEGHNTWAMSWAPSPTWRKVKWRPGLSLRCGNLSSWQTATAMRAD